MLNAILFVFVLLAIFSVGVFFALAGKHLAKWDKDNVFVRSARALFKKTDYIAAFGAGVFLTSYTEIAGNSYLFYRWTGLLDDVTVGSLINERPEIMETGQIPEDIIKWYAKMKETEKI